MTIKRTLATATAAVLILLLPALLAACGGTNPELSRSDVEEIVRDTIATLPATPPATPQMLEAIAPRRSMQAVYTQYFVNAAIERYEAQGRVATIDYYNTQASVDGQWYMFIMDENDVMLAHATIPDLVGQPASEIRGPNGYPTTGSLVAIASPEGAWFSYTFLNPAAGITEEKHSWVVRHDGLTFGSGWYEVGPRKSDQPAYTQAFVEKALNLYDALGREATIEYYNTEESVDDQWYVFIVDESGYTISHYNPAIRGRDPSLSVDTTGYFYGDDLRAATESGRWVRYTFNNPEADQEGKKHTWAVLHDGLIFGSGWYE